MSPKKMSYFSPVMPPTKYHHLMHQQLRDHSLFKITQNQFSSRAGGLSPQRLKSQHAAGLVGCPRIRELCRKRDQKRPFKLEVKD
jgi:hypothetical protein